MTDFRKKILLIAYIVLLALIFCYALFPEDAVKRHLVNRINQNLSTLHVTVESLHLSFPLSLSLGEVTVTRDSKVLLVVDRMRATPRLLSLLSSRKVVAFKGTSCGGKLSGRLGVGSGRDNPDLSLSCTLSDIELERVPSVSAETDLALTGSLSGEVNLSAAGMSLETGDCDLIISDCSFVTPVSLPGFQQLNFDRIDSNLVLDGNTLEVLNFNLEGPEVTGEVSGNVVLDVPLSRSDLDLEISATPLLSSTLSEITTYTFKVTGTFETPKIAPVSVQ